MNNTLDRLSYLHASDYDYSHPQDLTFDPCKNLNEEFQTVESENLKVFLRVRPSLPGDTQQDEDTHVEILDNHRILLTAPASSNTFKNSYHGVTKLSQKFTFSHIYGPATSQKELFDTSTMGLVKNFINGQNCLLFTYGATNSGKTFTVQGTPTNAGLLPRTLDLLFSSVGTRQYPHNDLKPKFFCDLMRLDKKDILKEEERKETIFKIGSELSSTLSQSTMSLSKWSISSESLNGSGQLSDASHVSQNLIEGAQDCSVLDADSLDGPGFIHAVFVSFAEIYNEYIFDLLDKMPSSKNNKRNTLMLGEDRNGAIYVKGLQEVRVHSAQEALRLLEIGRQNLHFAATRLNHNSSRSHCIFTIKLIRLANADSPHVARVSMLSLCDLAGAERAGKSFSNQDRLKEAGNINTSLLVLSRCIEALRRNQVHKMSKKREIPVPYRDSKLTRLFQSFLLGRGKVAMIVNISRMPLLFDETIQVLKFSAIAKQVTVSQSRESDVTTVAVKPTQPANQFSKFMRQSLKSSGRLSVPWNNKSITDITFGASENTAEGSSPTMKTVQEEEEEAEDERLEALVQLIGKLKTELVRAHKENVSLEDRLREELCTEFSNQIVEIENSWNRRLKDQQARSEELTEWKIQALMKSTKKMDGRKRKRPDDDPDDEYVSSIELFREQKKSQELQKQLDEMETDRKHLNDQVEALKNSQKRTWEQSSKVQEENSRLTFQLAQLTHNFNKLAKELEESKQVEKCSAGTESLLIHELKSRVEEKRSLLEEQDSEIKELKAMLCEAAEMYMAKEEECVGLEKNLKLREKSLTHQMLCVSEREREVEEVRSMLSQRAAQVEERDQYIEELRDQLSASPQKMSSTEDVNSQLQKQLEKSEKKMKAMEELYLREKSKLLLQVAELKRTRGTHQESTNNGPQEELRAAHIKTSQLQVEKDQLERDREQLVKDYQQLTDQLTENRSLFDHLRRANTTLESDHVTVAAERDQLKDSVQQLSEKLMIIQDERASEQLDASLRSEGVSAMNQLNNLQDKLLEKEALVDGLCKEVDDIQEKLLEKEALVDGLQKEVDERQQKLLEKEAILQDLHKDVDDRQQRLLEKEALVEDLHKEVEELRNTDGHRTQPTWPQEEQEAQIEHRQLEAKRKELETKLQEYEKETLNHNKLQEKCHELEDELENLESKLKEEEEDRERDSHLREKLSEAEQNAAELHQENVQSCKLIESLEEKVDELMDRLDERDRDNDVEKRALKLKIDGLEESIQVSFSIYRKLELEKESLEAQLNQDVCSKSDVIIKLESANELFRTELEEAKILLVEKNKAEEKLQNMLTEREAELEDETSLQKDNDTLRRQLDQNTSKLEELRLEFEAEKKSKDENNAKCLDLETELDSKDRALSNLEVQYEELNTKLEDLQAAYDKSQAVISKNEAINSRLSEIESLSQKLQEDRLDLKSQLVEKDKDIINYKEKSLHLETDLRREMNQLQAGQTDTAKFKRELERVNEEVDNIRKDRSELREKLEVVKELNHGQANLLSEKQDTIAALQAKIESLDYKLTRAEDEVDEKRDTARRLEAANDHSSQIRLKCDMLEKEICALREARQEEHLLHNSQVEEQQENINKKESEVSNLEQEVKRLLQQSVLSCNISRASESDLGHKVELNDLKEEVRRKEAVNDTFMQEILSLKSKMEKMSLVVASQSSARLRSTSNSHKDSMLEPGSPDISDTVFHHQSPVSSRRRGRKAQRTPVCTPSDMSHMGLDSSVERSVEKRGGGRGRGRGRPLTSTTCNTTASPPTATSATSQRTSQRTRRPIHDPSFQYEDSMLEPGSPDVSDTGFHHQSPVSSRRRGRNAQRTPVCTPSDMSHMGLDSSVERSVEKRGGGRGRGRGRPLTSTTSNTTASPTTTATTTTTTSQRTSRRTRRTIYDPSFQYEGPTSSGLEEDVWEPCGPPKRMPKSTRKSKTQQALPNPHIKDKENISSIGNKSDGSELLLPCEDSSSEVKKPSQRKKKHQLYKSDVSEPYMCSPDLLSVPEPSASPHSIVRRQLRTRRK